MPLIGERYGDTYKRQNTEGATFLNTLCKLSVETQNTEGSLLTRYIYTCALRSKRRSYLPKLGKRHFSVQKNDGTFFNNPSKYLSY